MARQLLEIYIENSTIYELAGSVESALFAEKLFISVATVKTHIQNMKIGQDSVTVRNWL